MTSARGLIIGKFLPPHRGHLHLVEQALREVGTLDVVVCTLEREPIPGVLRVEWMREIMAPHGDRVRVHHLRDELPSTPGEHPGFWTLWVDAIRRIVPGEIDLVATSEDYGDELARRLGASHLLVDRHRRTLPVSGSAIRARPLRHWGFIPPPVRPWFVRRVVLTGSESTGKTELAPRLAGHFGTVWSVEYAREHLHRKQRRTGRPLDEGDVEPIARGQIELEDRQARKANRLLVLDTDLVSTVVYARHYYGTCPAWIERAARERLATRYLLLRPDVPWIPDPQRDRGERRDELHALFRDTLAELGASVAEIGGDWPERFRRSVAAVEPILQED